MTFYALATPSDFARFYLQPEGPSPWRKVEMAAAHGIECLPPNEP